MEKLSQAESFFEKPFRDFKKQITTRVYFKILKTFG